MFKKDKPISDFVKYTRTDAKEVSICYKKLKNSEMFNLSRVDTRKTPSDIVE